MYLDWLLSREGQVAWSKATGYASLRQDVPEDNVYDYMKPEPGVKYLEQSKEDEVRKFPEIVRYVKTLIQ